MDNFNPSFFESLEQLRQSPQRRALDIVQHDYRPVLLQNVRQATFNPMGRIIPIVRYAIPRDACETVLHQIGQSFLAEQMRPQKTKISKRPEELPRYSTRIDQRLRIADLTYRIARLSAVTECDGMGERVIAHPMPMRDDLVEQSRARGITDAVSQHEEGRFDTALGQDGQNRLGDARGRAIIEGERDFLHCPFPRKAVEKLTGTYQVTLRAETGYRHIDYIAVRQIGFRRHAEANTRWCSGDDQMPRA